VADEEAVGALLERERSLRPSRAGAGARAGRAGRWSARRRLADAAAQLAEPDIGAAARTVPDGTRLFAIGVDGQGKAQLAELRHGSPVTLARFRVDLSQKGEPPAPPPIEQTFGWAGDIEPVGFPFRFGLIGRIQAFAFDAAGEVLLLASSNGILHAHRPTGPDEVLPRGWYKGELLRDVDAILGVPGGFVVAGHNRSALVAFSLPFPEPTRHGLFPPQMGTRARRLGPTSRPFIRSSSGSALLLTEWISAPANTRELAARGVAPEPSAPGMPGRVEAADAGAPARRERVQCEAGASLDLGRHR